MQVLSKAGPHFQTNAKCLMFFLQRTDHVNSGGERAHELILHGLVCFLLIEDEHGVAAEGRFHHDVRRFDFRFAHVDVHCKRVFQIDFTLNVCASTCGGK